MATDFVRSSSEAFGAYSPLDRTQEDGGSNPPSHQRKALPSTDELVRCRRFEQSDPPVEL
jgi:hypothetical protein